MLKLDILLFREELYILLRDKTRAYITFVSPIISNTRVLGLIGYILIEEGY
jgi:hypothetical protein